MKAPAHPPLYFVMGNIPDEPLRELVAFPAEGTRYAADQVIPIEAAAGLDPTAQAAGICWNPQTGEMDPLYVQPRWRRQGIATRLLALARQIADREGLPAVWVASTRTALGQVWGQSLGEPLVPLEELSQPMTPPEDIAGVERRLLVPDDPAQLLGLLEAAAPAGITGRELQRAARRLFGPANGVPLTGRGAVLPF